LSKERIEKLNDLYKKWYIKVYKNVSSDAPYDPSKKPSLTTDEWCNGVEKIVNYTENFIPEVLGLTNFKYYHSEYKY